MCDTLKIPWRATAWLSDEEPQRTPRTQRVAQRKNAKHDLYFLCVRLCVLCVLCGSPRMWNGDVAQSP